MLLFIFRSDVSLALVYFSFRRFTRSCLFFVRTFHVLLLIFRSDVCALVYFPFLRYATGFIPIYNFCYLQLVVGIVALSI